MRRRNHAALKALEELIGEPVTFGLYLKSIREGEEPARANSQRSWTSPFST